MAGRELILKDTKRQLGQTTKLTGLTLEQKINYLKQQNPDRAKDLEELKPILTRVLAKTSRDWNAPSDSLRDGD